MLETIIGYIFVGAIVFLFAAVLIIPLVSELKQALSRSSFTGFLKLCALAAIAFTLLMVLVSWR